MPLQQTLKFSELVLFPKGHQSELKACKSTTNRGEQEHLVSTIL